MRERRQESDLILSFLRSLWLKWGCTIDLFYQLFFFAVAVHVVTILSREDVLSELLYADDLVPMSEIVRNKLLKWTYAF